MLDLTYHSSMAMRFAIAKMPLKKVPAFKKTNSFPMKLASDLVAFTNKKSFIFLEQRQNWLFLNINIDQNKQNLTES